MPTPNYDDAESELRNVEERSRLVLPCPFCGFDPKTAYGGDPDGHETLRSVREEFDGGVRGAFRCGECGAQSACVEAATRDEWEVLALKAWNRRTPA